MNYAGNPDSAASGFCPAPPPPPPPPPAPGQAPALRINTAEAPRPRRPQNNNNNNNDPYEPPAAIQNAMMTKDKKPFTYTPGMGGKLDLSQIRSPRMARRVAKNANDEGIEGPPKSALEAKPSASANAGNIYVQPQVAVPVFPANMPVPQPAANRTPVTHVNRVPSNVSSEPPRSVGRNEGKVTPITIVPGAPSSPQSPTSPPQITLAKAPTPWLQNKTKQQEELPEWAKRAANKPIEVDPFDNFTPSSTIYGEPQQRSQNQSFVQSPSPQPHVVSRQQERVVPLRVEDRPSVFSVTNEPGHHQFKQSPNRQQRWGQPQPQPQSQMQQQQNQQPGGTRIIPIMVQDNGQSQARSIPVDVQGPKVVVHRGPAPGPADQAEPGPLQSRSFRVLQKITDTDSDTDVDANSEQIRKLQLTEDDKVLMNKFKDQAPRPASAINKKQNRNSKSFEEAQANLPASEQQVQEPRKYMGSAIPSRSFRILQAMTSPENIAPQENHQQDFTSRTENSVTGDQRSGVFYPNCPSPYWNPENGWWGYYPLQYPSPNSPNNIQPLNVAYNHPYAYCGYGDGNTFAYYPVYDHNYSHNYSHNYATPSQEGGGGDGGEDEANSDPCQGQPSAIHGYAPVPCYPRDQVDRQRRSNRDQYSHGTQGANSATSNDADSVHEASLVREPKATSQDSTFLTVPKWSSGNRNSTNVGRSNGNDEARNDERGVDAVENSMGNSARDDKDKDTSGRDASSKTDTDPASAADSDSSADTDSDSDTRTDSDSSDSESDSDSHSHSHSHSHSDSSSGATSDSESEYQAYANEREAPVAIILNDREPVKSNSDKECLQSLSATTVSDDFCEHSSRLSSDKLSCSDCDTDADDEYQIESLNNDCVLPHQLSVIYEDTEQTETESESRKLECLKEKDEALGEAEDPPDENDDATVSVSLPLRFKFSVSENNEDVATVVVGDSTVKSGRKTQREERISRSRGEPDDSSEVHVNFQITNNNNTSVDFTLKKHNRESSSDESSSFDTEFTLTKDQMRVDVRESAGESVGTRVSLDGFRTDENANFKIDSGRENPTQWKENFETEFTIRRKKTDVTRHVWKKDLDLESQKELETRVDNDEPLEDTETSLTVRNGERTNTRAETGYDTEYDITTSSAERRENVHKETVRQKSLKIKERDTVRTEFDVRKIRKTEERTETSPRERDAAEGEAVAVAVEKNQEEQPSDHRANGGQSLNAAKRLLSVQNSRDETDDEDSGVTSDMSRIISEVDTDSECASVKRTNKYQRTQTHSRLFKLLNDDAILAEEDHSCEERYSPARRERLSLPLKANVFNYDENYYSNYSSGITSPDYSPLCEQPWRRINEGARSLESENSSSVTTPNEICSADSNETAASYGLFHTGDKPGPTDDPYFQTWKKVVSPVQFDYDILPSIAFKKLTKLENGTAGYRGENHHQGKGNRINVLCPRIKSSKNVPHALQRSSSKKSTIKATTATAASSIPFLSTKSSLKNGHC